MTHQTMLYFRTQTGHEVDIILEETNRVIVGIEIKSSKTVRGQDFCGLLSLAEVSGDDFRKSVVLYGGSEIVYFGSNLFAMPIFSLWNPL